MEGITDTSLTERPHPRFVVPFIPPTLSTMAKIHSTTCFATVAALAEKAFRNPCSRPTTQSASRREARLRPMGGIEIVSELRAACSSPSPQLASRCQACGEAVLRLLKSDFFVDGPCMGASPTEKAKGAATGGCMSATLGSGSGSNRTHDVGSSCECSSPAPPSICEVVALGKGAGCP